MTTVSIPSSLRRVALAGGAVIVLGGAAVGIAAAQTQPSATPTAEASYQKFVDSLAQKLGVSSQTLQQDITQARQDAGLPANGGFPGQGRGGPRPGAGGPGGVDFQAAATAIGITPQQLRTELQGKSLTQVAQAHSKNAADVATALKNAAHQRIDQEVSSGRLTADQGNTRKTAVDQRIDQLMTQTLPQAGAGGPGRPGPGGFGGAGGPGALFRQGLDTAAQAMGISAQQLRTEIQGKSQAQVVQAHGKQGADVATALKTAANQRIDQAVTNGRLTADQANTMKTNIGQQIDNFVNQVVPQGGPGPRRGPAAPAPAGDQPADATGA